MKAIIPLVAALVTAGLITPSQPCGAASWEGTDDFSTGIASAKWTTYQYSQGQMLAVGANGHVSYIVPISTTNEQQAIIAWNGTPTAAEDWTVDLSGHNTANWSANGSSQLQLYVFDASATQGYRISMAGGWSGSATRMFTAGSSGAGQAAPATNADFGLRLVHRSGASGVIEAWYDSTGTGTSWTKLDTRSTGDIWPGLGPTNLLQIGVFANCYYGPITEGQVYAENFRFTRITSPAPTFNAQSAVITNPWLGLTRVGQSYSLTGIGDCIGGTWTSSLVGQETVLGINCLILRDARAGGNNSSSTIDIRIAQDVAGNLWGLKVTGNLTWAAGSLAEAIMLFPATPLAGQRIQQIAGEYSDIIATDQVVPQLSNGLGPYSGCIQLRWSSADGTDTDDSWSAPGLGKVKEVWSVTAGQVNGWERTRVAPTAITLISPTGTLEVNPTQRYTWQLDAAASRYEVYILRNGSLLGDKWFNLSDSVADSASGNFAVDVGGHGSGTYQWWVRGWSADGNGPWSGPMSFSQGIPGSVTLLAPANNASLTNRHPQLTWSQSSPAATWFRILVTHNQAAYLDQWIAGTTNWTPAADLPAGSYTWWVQPYNNSGLGPWSTNASFTIPWAVPGTLIPVSPTAGSVASNLKQPYTWRADPAATWYELYVIQNGALLCDRWLTPSDSVAQHGSGNFAVEIGGHIGGSYQWWARGWAPDGMGPWSSMGTYTMATVPPPGAVTLLTPANNASVVARQPALTWTASSPAASWYNVYVARNGTKYFDQWVAGTNRWSVTSDLPGGTYTWSVRPWSEVGYGAWSATSSFTVQTAAPGALVLLSPSGSVAAGLTQRYTWQADAGATWYELYLLRNGSPFGDRWYQLTDSLAGSGIGNFAVDISGHSAGTYQWWVRGWGPDGLGTWSSSMTFNVAAP